MEANMIYKWIKKLDFTNCITFKKFNNKSKFIKICDIVLYNDLTKDNKKKRNTLIKLSETNINKDFNIQEKNEWCYIITIDNFIVKIGGTRTGIKNRFNSYLCGHHSIENNKSGKASVTNKYIYNTLYYYLKLNSKIELYGYKLPEHKILIEDKLEKIQTYHIYESKLLNNFKEKYNNFPPLSFNKDPTVKNK